MVRVLLSCHCESRPRKGLREGLLDRTRAPRSSHSLGAPLTSINGCFEHRTETMPTLSVLPRVLMTEGASNAASYRSPVGSTGWTRLEVKLAPSRTERMWGLV